LECIFISRERSWTLLRLWITYHAAVRWALPVTSHIAEASNAVTANPARAKALSLSATSCRNTKLTGRTSERIDTVLHSGAIAVVKADSPAFCVKCTLASTVVWQRTAICVGVGNDAPNLRESTNGRDCRAEGRHLGRAHRDRAGCRASRGTPCRLHGRGHDRLHGWGRLNRHHHHHFKIARKAHGFACASRTNHFRQRPRKGKCRNGHEHKLRLGEDNHGFDGRTAKLCRSGTGWQSGGSMARSFTVPQFTARRTKRMKREANVALLLNLAFTRKCSTEFLRTSRFTLLINIHITTATPSEFESNDGEVSRR
jgi:hypothetical protein